jgi:hypothetical protein
MGDYIRIDDETGLVTRIGTFFFTLEQHQANEYLKVPNSIILNRPIHNLGSGKFRQEIKIRLSSIPGDLHDRLTELSTFIKSRNHFKENIKCHLSTDDEGWHIAISFPNTYKQENLKPAILMKVQELLLEHLKIST